jgi:hypothetical protein
VKHKPDKTGFTKSILECVCADNDLQITWSHKYMQQYAPPIDPQII